MIEDLNQLLVQVDHKNAEYKSKTIDPQKLDDYEDSYLIEAVYNSAALDGNTLSIEDVKAVLNDNAVISGKGFGDHLIVFGLFLARRLAQKMIDENIPVDEHGLQMLHATLLFYKPVLAGQYRNFNMQVGEHRACDYSKIPYKMTQLCESLRTLADEDPIEAAAFFHLRLEKIHPFGDGNGRLGRLIANIMLAQAGYPQVIFDLERKQEYFDAISAYEGLNGNPTQQPMQMLLTELVDAQLDRLLAL
jgi:Fic family protein